MTGILCMIGTTEIIVVCILALLLFGGKKIPELMRGLGQGVRNFKQGMNEPLPEEQYHHQQETQQQKENDDPTDSRQQSEQ